MIISVDSGQAFDNIKHLVFIKTVRKLGIEGNFLDSKNICKNSTANIIFNGEKLNFPVKIRNKAKMPLLLTSALYWQS
jgi:hypothetical protein